MAQIGIATSIPFVMAAGPIVGYFLGSWLDGWLSTGPYLMTICSILGLVSSARETIKLIQRLNQISDDEKDPDDNIRT